MIYVIITTSIKNKYGIKGDICRKKRYIHCISRILELTKMFSELKPIIVENNGKRKTFLDEFDCDVVYTDNNSITYQNKGVNEMKDIKYIIDQYNIKDDDLVIKITGRYYPLTDSFFSNVIHSNYDAYIKFFDVIEKKETYDSCVLGLICTKAKYLTKFEYKCKTTPEAEFASYIIREVNHSDIYEVNKLDLKCCFADNLRSLVV